MSAWRQPSGSHPLLDQSTPSGVPSVGLHSPPAPNRSTNTLTRTFAGSFDGKGVGADVPVQARRQTRIRGVGPRDPGRRSHRVAPGTCTSQQCRRGGPRLAERASQRASRATRSADKRPTGARQGRTAETGGSKVHSTSPSARSWARPPCWWFDPPDWGDGSAPESSTAPDRNPIRTRHPEAISVEGNLNAPEPWLKRRRDSPPTRPDAGGSVHGTRGRPGRIVVPPEWG